MTPSPFDPMTARIEKGITLIEASAGTGKTYSLSLLAVRMLAEGTVTDISRLLIVTFTNAATAELVGRIRARLRDAADVLGGALPKEEAAGMEALRERLGRRAPEASARLRTALRRFDQAAICTIHSFCEQALRHSAFESGAPFETQFLEMEEELLEEAAADFWRQWCLTKELPAALAAIGHLDRAACLAVFRARRRAPEDAVLLPASPALPEALRAADAALAKARAAWNAGQVASIARETAWKKEAPLSEESLAGTLADLAALAGGDTARGIAAALNCSQEAIEVARNKRTKSPAPAHPFFTACSDFAAAVARLEHSFLSEFLRSVEERFEQAKARRHVLTFDDLLRRLNRALKAPGTGARLAAALAARYEAALVDEFQDTDPVQCEIFMRALAGRPLVFVGDPKQAIYGFRGADIHAYLDAQRHAQRLFTLQRNYRSEPGMIGAVNALFGPARRPFLFEGIAFRPGQAARDFAGQGLTDATSPAPMQWWFVPPRADKRPLAKEEAETVILEALTAEVCRLLDGGARIGDRPLRAGDVAVLVRTNAQAQVVRERLRRAGVPCVVSGDASILDSREMRELELVLRAIHDPQDGPIQRAALATETWGLDAEAIRRLAEDDAETQRRTDALALLRDTWQREGFMPMIERFFAQEGVRARLLAFEDGERRLTNLLHAAELLHRAVEDERLSPEGLFTWVARAREGGLADAESAEMRLESDAEALQIVTIHKSKGLQYGVVFCPWLWDARPADTKDAFAVREGERTLFFGAAESAEKKERLPLLEAERMAEDLRLAYVAITRAIHRCYLVWGHLGHRSAHASALTYLLEQPDDAPADGPGWVETVKTFARERMDEWQADLEGRVKAAGALMQMRTIGSEAAAPRPALPPMSADALSPRLFQGDTAQLAPWIVTSYTGLVSNRHQREEPDHEDLPAARKTGDAPARGIGAFGRGPAARGRAAETGTCLHEILERCDFSRPDGGLSDPTLREMLERYDLLRPEAHAAPLEPVAVVREMLHRVADAPLDGVALAQVAPERRAAEWGFYLPLAPLVPRDLAALFARHAAEPLRRLYPPRLAQLSSHAIWGYLSGFIDLVFEHGGRWSVADWKSNDLGSAPEDYDRPALLETMCETHYVLQYHLYCAALHRHLRARLPGYDYDRAFGGVWYLFLRGLDGGGRGLWHDRPPRALIEGLSAFFEGRSAP